MGSGEISSIGNGTWKIGEDTIFGIGSNYSIVSAGDGLYKIVEIEDEVEESLGNYFSINGSTSTQILRGSIATEYDDTIYAENLSTSINAGDGSDLISVISGSGTINGGSGAYLGTTTVTIVGSGEISSIGNGTWKIGEDTIFGIGSNYSIVSAGDGLYKIVEIEDEVEESLGNYFSINGSTSTQILRGSIATEYDDTIYAENLSTSINAGAGSDIISVISGSGTIDGGSGADQIYLGTTTVTIVGSGEISSIGNGTWKIGEDTISGIGSNYSIVGAGDGLYKITEIEDEVEESLGNYFSINGANSTQILRGSIATNYDDTIYAENLSTSINAGDGSDLISVISGSGTINGGSGASWNYNSHDCWIGKCISKRIDLDNWRGFDLWIGRE